MAPDGMVKATGYNFSMPYDPDPSDHCPHCGGQLYPSREQKLESQRFWSTIAGFSILRRPGGDNLRVALLGLVKQQGSTAD
jgi:hypothetical protein